MHCYSYLDVIHTLYRLSFYISHTIILSKEVSYGITKSKKQ
jgi:hypothetical protein